MKDQEIANRIYEAADKLKSLCNTARGMGLHVTATDKIATLVEVHDETGFPPLPILVDRPIYWIEGPPKSEEKPDASD